jgi:hypothetical protein
MNNYNERCFGSQKSSVKRCRNYIVRNNNHLCQIHLNDVNKNKELVLYNGSVVTYDSKNMIKSATPFIKTWRDINKNMYDKKKNLEKEAKLTKKASYNSITDALVKTGLFVDKKNVDEFFNKQKKSKKEVTSRMIHYYSVINYYKRNDDKLKKLQLLVRLKLKYKNSIDKIKKIQRWYRNRKWIKSLPVSPERFRNHYMKNIDKIVLLQRKIKEFINTKIKHSYGCPYSQEEYHDIPRKFRVCYKYKINNITFWRYYDIRWIHQDFLRQSENKRFVIEPVTKEEYPEEFVKEVAKKAWYITRKTNQWAIDEEKYRHIRYEEKKDYDTFFKKRTLYCFTLLLYDFQEMIGCKFNENISWRSEDKMKYQYLYLKTMPLISNILLSIPNYYSLYNTIYSYTREILNTDAVLNSSYTTDEVAGRAMYGLYVILYCLRRDEHTKNLISSIIKDNIEVIFYI